MHYKQFQLENRVSKKNSSNHRYTVFVNHLTLRLTAGEQNPSVEGKILFFFELLEKEIYILQLERPAKLLP